jgi:hypothetical protein
MLYISRINKKKRYEPPCEFVTKLLIEDIDIYVRTLRDKQQYSDPDGTASRMGISSASWPLFGIIWSSSEVLAHLMFDYEIEGVRILEVIFCMKEIKQRTSQNLLNSIPKRIVM